MIAEPEHLPRCPVDRLAYDQLYAFTAGVDEFSLGNGVWQEVRIRPGLAEEAVYRLLPSARDFEFGG